jgi:plastocyanin
MALLPGPAEGAADPPVEVAVKNNFFDPQTTKIIGLKGGATVLWTWGASAGGHDVVEDHGLFDSGLRFGPDSFQREVSSGTFEYTCTEHGGMDGQVRVRPFKLKEPAGRQFTVVWARQDSQTGRAFDVQFRKNGGEWKNWKVNTVSNRAVFGSGSPRVDRGDSFKFRARSQKRFDIAEARSLWSPILEVPIPV